MNRKRMMYLGILVESIGILLVFICIIRNVIVPTIVQLLIWIGLATTIFFAFFCKNNAKEVKQEEYKIQKYVILALIVLIALTLFLTIFATR